MQFASEVMSHQSTGGFWREDLWLSPNVTWQRTQDAEGFPRVQDLLYVLPVALVLLVLRWVVERFIVTPFGLAFGLDPGINEKMDDVIRDKLLAQAKASSPKLLWPFYFCLCWIGTQISAWINGRKESHQLSVLQKFRETGWRFLFYTALSAYGLTVLWNKSWFWDINRCWDDVLSQHVTDDIWWYYLVELGFNISVMFTQLVFDNKRKDFWMAVIHHLVSIFLISLSWLVNAVRFGTLILICHDVTDPFVEIAKACIYLKWQKAADISFFIFAVAWIILRIGVFPFILLLNAYRHFHEIIGSIPEKGLLSVLYCLLVMHVIWTYMILRMVYTTCKNGKLEDTRSETDEDKTEDLQLLKDDLDDA